jgi:membrane protease YdiL (CAAX protease family)
MTRRPPGTFRVAWLVSRLALTRLANRVSAFKRAGTGRGATPRKAAAGRTLLGILALLFAFQAVTFTAAALGRAAHVAEQSTAPTFVFVHPWTYYELGQLAERGACKRPLAEPALAKRLAEAFDLEGYEHRDTEDRAAYRRGLRREFEAHCLSRFRDSLVGDAATHPSTRLWFRGAGPLAVPKGLAPFALLFTLMAVLQAVAGMGRDLTDIDQRFEWLFSFPVRARSLFLARMLSMALTAPLLWVLVWPFYASVFWSAGYTWLGIPLGAFVTLYVGMVAGALRVVAETTLPRLLSTRNVSRIQAVLGLLGTVALVPAFALAYTPGLSWVYERALALPNAVLYTPATAPLLLAADGQTPLVGALVVLVSFVVVAFGAVLLGERMVSNGVVASSGVEPGRRGIGVAEADRDFGPRGVARKELRALFRDRQLRTQAFLTPVLALGAQVLLNPSLLRTLGANGRTVAAAAFGTAAFSLLTGAFNGLAIEGHALWTLYTAPVPLERLLLSKVHVWVGVASSFAALVLGGFIWHRPALLLPCLATAPLVFAGVYLYSIIGLGLGALGTDPLEPEPRRRLRPGATYLFLLLVSLFAYALYSSSLWAKVVELVLSSLLAYAIWQKLKEHLPYLLDPTEAPPPSIAVADGVLTALGFFAFQGLFMLLFRSEQASLFKNLTLAFAAAGVAVTGAALWFFKKSRVPDLYSALGLVRPSGRGSGFVFGAAALGIAAGAAAAVFGVGYKALVMHVPALHELVAGKLDPMSSEVAGSERVWLTLLAVVAAPLFEEFIFRGVLYRGFRRSFGPLVAAFLSALVFALVHPAASALPVFVMALLAALVYERFRWLLAPMLTHFTYNAVMVGATLWLR